MLCGAQITIFVVLVSEITPKISVPCSRNTVTYCMFQQPTHFDCHYSAKLMNKCPTVTLPLPQAKFSLIYIDRISQF